MSYTHSVAYATCTVNNFLDVSDLCHALYAYLSDNSGEVPQNLFDCAGVEEFADAVEGYIELNGEHLTISLDTEEANNDNEIFDCIASYCALRMSSKFMKITYISDDSREGLSADTTYYDNTDSFIDIESLILSR
jgi:hypothetical protein